MENFFACKICTLKKEGTKLCSQAPLSFWNKSRLPSLHGKYKGEKMEAVTYFIFLGSKVTVDGDCRTKLKDACSLEGKL